MTDGEYSDYCTDKNNSTMQILFESLVENARNVIMVIDKNYDISYINHTISYYDKKDVIGKPFYMFVHPDFKELVIDKINSVFQTGNPTSYEALIASDAETASWYETRLSPIFFDGEIISISAIAQDINNEKKAKQALQESEEKYRLIFEMSPIGITTADKKGKIININQSGADITGHSREELIGKKYNELNFIDKKTIFKILKDFPKIIKGKPLEPIELDVIDVKGMKHIVDVHISPIRDNGKFTGTQVMMQDITNRKKAEKELRESEKKYRKYINNAPDGVFVCDKQGRYLEVNYAATQITGYTKEELLHMNIGELTHPEYAGKAMQHFKRVKETGYSSGENCFIHKDGSKHFWRVDAVKLTENRYLGFTKDITKMVQSQERIKEEQKKTDSILNAATDGIRIISKDMKIQMMNQKMSDMTNISVEQAYGRTCSELFKSNHCGTDECSMKKVLSTGEGFEIEDMRILPTGEQIPYLLSVTPYRDEKGEIVGIIEDFRDISQIKQADENLRKAHDELQTLNKELEKEVEERTNRIQQLLKQKDEFINQLGHDLKNPLGPMLQLLPIVEKKEQDPKQKEILHVINRNVSYMTNLVAKIIQLAKLNSPNSTIRCAALDLKEEFDEILYNNRILLDENKVTAVNMLTEGVQVNVDKLKVDELITNIVNNAMKYANPEGGKITIKQIDGDDSFVTIAIKDTGTGMTRDQLDNVFNEFYKVDNSRHDFDSSGLGMTICKRIIEMHGGRIWAESDGIGKGSTFYFTLPKNDN